MSELLCSSEKLVTKANDRESYRLWFEFLKRAIADPDIKVDLKLYSSWGDVTNVEFETWWRRIGSKITSLETQTTIELVTSVSKSELDFYLRVPKVLTATQASIQLKKLLLSINHQAHPVMAPLRVREGAEIRHAICRAYLVTFDAHKKLMHSGIDESKKIEGKHILKEVRRVYAAREAWYIGGVTAGPKIDKLPSSLYGSKGPASEDIDTNLDAQAIATVKRYLKKAQEIIANVANGRFPD